MDSMYIFEKLRGILCETGIFGESEDIPEDAVLLGKGGFMDSLAAISFVTQVEDAFGVDIINNDLNLDSMESLDKLADYINSRSPDLEKPETIAAGWHLLADCGGCDPGAMNSTERVRLLIRELAFAAGLTIQREGYHSYTPVGVTGFAIVSESHISVHTWPEYNYAAVDVFSCKTLDKEKILAVLTEKLGCVCECRLIQRNAAAGRRRYI